VFPSKIHIQSKEALQHIAFLDVEVSNFIIPYSSRNRVPSFLCWCIYLFSLVWSAIPSSRVLLFLRVLHYSSVHHFTHMLTGVKVSVKKRGDLTESRGDGVTSDGNERPMSCCRNGVCVCVCVCGVTAQGGLCGAGHAACHPHSTVCIHYRRYMWPLSLLHTHTHTHIQYVLYVYKRSFLIPTDTNTHPLMNEARCAHSDIS